MLKRGTNMTNGNNLAQELNKQSLDGKLVNEDIIEVAREVCAEGIVLLKNDGALPLKKTDKVAVFGRCAINYFAVGYGSGGDVVRPYVRSIIDGLETANVLLDKEILECYKKWLEVPENKPNDGGWGKWPMSFPEMPLTEEMIKAVATRNDVAIIVIGRAAGEDRENKLEEGSYYLTNEELNILNLTTNYFKKVVIIMDCGNVIDMSWAIKYGNKISAILYAWQGGMEGGNAIADILTGNVNPSGRLTDTISINYDVLPNASDFGRLDFNNYVEDIYVGYRYFETFAKDAVLYPFGFGLSYTSFDYKVEAKIDNHLVTLDIIVTNTGLVSGKDVVEAYLSLPQGVLGKPQLILSGFAKTNTIQPNKCDRVCITFDLKDFASYDDLGKTGYKSAYVLEAGSYEIFVGSNVRDNKSVLVYNLKDKLLIKQLTEVMAVKNENSFKRIVNKDNLVSFENVACKTNDLRQIILKNMPMDIKPIPNRMINLLDVKKQKYSLDEFVATLSLDDLDDLSHGEGSMNSKLGVNGNAGAFGGIRQSLRDKGIPPVITTDGPAGVRVKHTCSLLPCGTALACSFNLSLVEKLYGMIALEMKYYNVDVLLAPGMNIHRNPLCGRNFEYFSEDPLITGKMGVAVVNGLQKGGVSASPKHFACNNQETNRSNNDSRVSERALREIYLKGFEIMVKESNPHTIMTSYNKINGIWSHYNYELVTTVLRNEWGYNGLVITDWWMRKDVSREFPIVENDAYRIRSQVDVLMPGENDFTKKGQTGRATLESYGKDGGITLGELQRTAKNVLNYILKYKM